MRFTRTAALLAAFAAVSATYAVPSRPITLAYKLPKKAHVVRPAIPPALLAGPVRVEVVDGRGAEDSALVGAQTEKTDEIYHWRAKQQVAPAVGGIVTAILKSWSIAAARESDLALSIRLDRLWVHEKSAMFGSSYEAEAALRVSLVDRSGTASWTRDVEGRAAQSAVDGRESVCNELFTLALHDALTKALGEGEARPSPSGAEPKVVVEPAVLLDELVRLKGGGVADDVLIAYVKKRQLSRSLTVDEILAWKNAGLPDEVIRQAVQ
jgi:hypothetical protein